MTVSSSSGLGCPDAVLAAIGRRFRESGHPRGITTLHPIAAGDMSGIKGIDHIAQDGSLARILAGSYPSGPSSAEPPLIWQMITGNRIPAITSPPASCSTCIGRRRQSGPACLPKSASTPSPIRRARLRDECEGCRRARGEENRLRRGGLALFFKAITPEVAIIRATTADERGNLSYEHEGALLGAMEQALSVRKQWRHRHRAGQAHRAGRLACARMMCAFPAFSSIISLRRRTSCRRRRSLTTGDFRRDFPPARQLFRA